MNSTMYGLVNNEKDYDRTTNEQRKINLKTRSITTTREGSNLERTSCITALHTTNGLPEPGVRYGARLNCYIEQTGCMWSIPPANGNNRRVRPSIRGAARTGGIQGT